MQLNSDALQAKVGEVLHSMKVSTEDCENVERCTRSQKDSSHQHEQRYGHLTTSFIFNISVRKSFSNPDAFIGRLGARKYLSLIPAIKWGVEHESNARDVYNLKMASLHDGFKYPLLVL